MKLLGDVGEKLRVDVIGQEGVNGARPLARVYRTSKSVFRAWRVSLRLVLSLETLAIEPNVPVGSVVNKLQETGDDRV